MEKLLLIDGHSILNRAFFGLPDLTNAKGVHTGAVIGFINIMLKQIETERPDYLTVAFDVHAPTFRHERYAEYKGTRKAMAEELKQQVPMIHELLSAMGIVTVEKEGYEADDILGTLAKQAASEGIEAVVLSGDRDLLQLADEHIKIVIPKTKRTGTVIEEYYAKDVIESKGVTPEEFIDVKALWGDTADNIPGVPGIGEKTATAIIQKYHTVEEAYAHADELKPPRASKNLKEYYEQALLSKELATIEIHAPVEYDIKQARYGDIFTEEAYLLCKEWEFKKLLSRFSVEGPKTDAAKDFETADRFDDLIKLIEETPAGAPLGLAFWEEEKKLLGIAVSDGRRALFFAGEPGDGFLEKGADALWCMRDKKETLKAVASYPGLCGPLMDAACFDASLAAYLLNPLANSYTTEDIARDALGMTVASYADTFGKKAPSSLWEERPEAVRDHFCNEAYVAAAARAKLSDALKEAGMTKLYEEVELPLVNCLFDMEREGIAVSEPALREYGANLQEDIDRLEASIYDQAGEKFNINSPKQLGVILFEKLGMPHGKKTKTGYSTAAGVLERLAPEYPIVSDILMYRQLTKLKSTYADGLADCIAEDGRIHTTFQQTVTATGRLSSTEPNLQNIPIRMELGKLIRKVFYPKEGTVFADADYSQIELRVLAHMSGDENLIEAYRQNKDIHRSTAARVFHVPFEEVTDLQRRNAKAVNFGIVYGISSFGLGAGLDISRKEAQQYIDDYYAAYPKLKDFLDGCIASAKETGICRTLFGRIRPMPEITSSNFMQRSFGERVAMNAPIQGTAADIIKIAMVRVYERLKREGLESKLILQVHDELLIEAKIEELDEVKRILEEEMKGAAELAVSLEIDLHTGETWYDAK